MKGEKNILTSDHINDGAVIKALFKIAIKVYVELSDDSIMV